MRIGASLVLIALGAILRFAVTVRNPHGFNYHTGGVILMIVGAIGLVLTAVWMMSRRRTDVVQQGPVVQQAPVGTTRSTYVEPPPSY